MKTLWVLMLAALLTPVSLQADNPAQGSAKPDSPAWNMNATIIEACSCPMFCQCYFNPEPASHGVSAEHQHGGGEHFCRFNNAIRVNAGSYGDVKLDGAKFWVYGDLGADFSKGQMDWAVVTFDRSLDEKQRAAIGQILGAVYPVQWASLTTAEGDIEWVQGGSEAHATIDGGKTAEVRLSTGALNRNVASEPVVIRNLKYWGVPRHDGFVLMPNTVEAVRAGEKTFEFKGTNGFMITFDVNSKDVAMATK